MSANRLIMLMLPPRPQSTPSAAMNDTGIPTATQNATRALRKRYSTAITRTSPPRAVLEQQQGPIADQLPGFVVGIDLHARRPLAPAAPRSTRGGCGRTRGLSDFSARLSSRLTEDRPPKVVRISPLRARRSTVATSPRARNRPSSAGAQREALEAGLLALLVERAKLLGGLVPADAAGRQVHARGRDPAGRRRRATCRARAARRKAPGWRSPRPAGRR